MTEIQSDAERSPQGTGDPTARFPSRTRKRLETRERLFDAAMAAFRRDGVATTRIDQVVRKAGVARGTFYLHFPTKDHVLMELLRRKQVLIAQRLVAGATEEPSTFLHLTVDAIADAVALEGPDISREIFMMVLRNADETEGEVAALLDATSAYFAAAQHRKWVRNDLEPNEIVALFLTSVFGLLLLKRDIDGAPARTELHQAVDVFVRGIAPDGSCRIAEPPR